MKRTFSAFALLLLTAPLTSHASGERLIPAGSLIQCMVDEPKLSSKTAAIGDPVLCRVNHVEAYGRSVLPYGSYLVGYFEDYKDPGHFVGKGWMELRFDRMVIEPDTVIPVSARVVAVPKYNVDRQGRIMGNGHAVRDTIEWMIPILWPIDLINLPRRGPRPVLKAETRLTLKLMDDLGVPGREEAPQQPGLLRRPASYTPQPTYSAPPQQTIINQYAAPQYAAPAPPQVVVRPQVVYQLPPPPVRVVAPPYGYYGYGYPPAY